MSYSYRVIEQDVTEMNKRIDAEILLSLCSQAELVDLDQYINQSYSGQANVDEIIFNMSRTIIKHRFDSMEGSVIRIHRNQMGFSVSVKTDGIQEILEFVAGHYQVDNRDRNFNHEAFNQFLFRFRRPQLTTFELGSTFQVKSNRVVFYFRYNENHHYRNAEYLVFNALFEMVHLVEDWEVAAQEQLPTFLAQYNEHNARRDQIEREERERREQAERELRERQERERREREERERIERERREAEERHTREEYQRRQSLIQAGATNEGIDIANRLLDLLGRGNS